MRYQCMTCKKVCSELSEVRKCCKGQFKVLEGEI